MGARLALCAFGALAAMAASTGEAAPDPRPRPSSLAVRASAPFSIGETSGDTVLRGDLAGKRWRVDLAWSSGHARSRLRMRITGHDL